MKEELRRKVRALKKQLTSEQIQEYSRKITDTFLAMESFLTCKTIYSYVSYNQEPDTKEIIWQALGAGKKVAVPKVTSREIEFFYIRGEEDLKPGYQGILEPVTDWKADDAKAVMIMPGLAFDYEYNRLGYGGGYYDRYLAAHTKESYEKIAFAYDFQVVSKIETEIWDEKVDTIITPTCII